MGSERPHHWLGEIYQNLLPQLRGLEKSVRLAVTRPSGRSYGEGALRVLRVIESEESLQLLLAYERYQPPYFKKKSRGRKKRR